MQESHVVKPSIVPRRLPRLVKGHRVVLEETREIEFKAMPQNSKNPVSEVVSKVERYVVAFLNAEGGSIFWGIDDNGIANGVGLDYRLRNDLRTEVSNKLAHIQPSSAWTPGAARVELHPLFGSADTPDPLGDQYVVEV